MRRLFVLPVLALLGGCPGGDKDEDGLTNGEEKDLGTDPKIADTDGDGLLDGEEVNTALTDPLVADTDADGLVDGDEDAAGCDPLVADGDGDGYLDGAEVDAGTNPNQAYSHPYEGGYAVGNCDTLPTPTGATGEGRYQTYTWPAYQEGDVPDNFTLVDQYGEMVDLYSFCGQVVLLELGAFW